MIRKPLSTNGSSPFRYRPLLPPAHGPPPPRRPPLWTKLAPLSIESALAVGLVGLAAVAATKLIYRAALRKGPQARARDHQSAGIQAALTEPAVHHHELHALPSRRPHMIPMQFVPCGDLGSSIMLADFYERRQGRRVGRAL